MAGIQLSALVDLFLATSQAVLTGENFILNEAQPRKTLLRQIMKAHDMMDMLQGGDSITDQVIFDEDQTYAAYNPLEPKSPRLSNHLTETTVQWAFTDANVTFSKHEKGLNQASNLKRGARAMVFKKIIKAKWSNLFININRGMEREFFAQPIVGLMETVTGSTTRVPYSLFATIHEFGSTTTTRTATVPPGWTTIQGINPTTQARWRNPVEYYADGKTEIDAGTTGSWDGFDAFSSMSDRLCWEELAIRPEYGEEERMPDAFYFCSRNGKRLYEHATRTANDHTRHGPSNAAYPGLNFDGAPIKWIEAMDTAVVWPGSSGTVLAGENDATVDEAGAATTNPDIEGPRFVCLVPKYYKKIVHDEHFLEEETPPANPEQPYVRTVFFDCWHQNFNRSRQRAGGVIAPSADIDGYITG